MYKIKCLKKNLNAPLDLLSIPQCSFATENLWANPHVQNPERFGHCTDVSKPVGRQRTIFAVTCFPLKTGKTQEKPNKYHHRRLFYKRNSRFSSEIPPTNTSGKKVSVVYCVL